MVDSLFAITRAQLVVALGAQYLFKIEKEKIGNKIVNKKQLGLLLLLKWKIF